MAKKLFTVFGATGAQGAPVLRRLLAAGHRVRAVGHTAGKVAGLAGEGVEPIALDLADPIATARALDGADGAFLQLPFIPLEAVIAAQARSLARALVVSRVPLAVFTTSGPVATGSTGIASFETKVLAERELRGSGAPLIVLRPTGYLGNLSAPFCAPSVVRHHQVRYPLPREHRQAWISVEDQAALAAAALDRPQLVGRTFAVGTRLSGPELAEQIGRGLGRAIDYQPLTPEAFGRSVGRALGEAVGLALTADYRAMVERSALLGLDAETDSAWRELGVTATPVSSWARDQPWEASAAQWPFDD